jgi:hypothetical protein
MPDLFRASVAAHAANSSHPLTREIWAVFFELVQIPIVGVDSEQPLDRVEVNGPVRPSASTRTILDLSRLITRLDDEDDYAGTEYLSCALVFDGLVLPANTPSVDFSAYRVVMPVETEDATHPSVGALRHGAEQHRSVQSLWDRAPNSWSVEIGSQ